MTTSIVFIIGIVLGGAVGALLASVLIDEAIEAEPVVTQGIDPKALIAWLENHRDNYEYIAPPTTGEIIRKIKEMSI